MGSNTELLIKWAIKIDLIVLAVLIVTRFVILLLERSRSTFAARFAPVYGVLALAVRVVNPAIVVTAAAGIAGGVKELRTPSAIAFEQPIWNMWAEPAISRTEVPSAPAIFTPTLLEPNREYSLVLNLAGLSLSDGRTRTVFSHE